MPLSEVQFSNVLPAISETDLALVETAYGFTFPAPIRKHYLKYNGGRPKKPLFHCGECSYVVQEFLPVKFGPVGDRFEDTLIDLKIERQLLPQRLVPFAFDPGLNYFCFSTAAEDYGAIFFFNLERWDEAERAERYICASLTEFVDGLKPDRID